MIRLHTILKSSRAAIDLASIMVGIIIIGLIGGVISATVFAVIPWSQDNAAKNQLESIHTAENAFFGLSSDANQSLKKADGTIGSFKNTFTSSAELDVNNLLNLSSSGMYCVVATADGKDYHAYVKSGSGKWFYALNSKKSPQLLAADINPCITDSAPFDQTPGTVDSTVDDGSAGVPTAPQPISNVVAKIDFEDKVNNFKIDNNPVNRTQTLSFAAPGYDDKYSLYYYGEGEAETITRTFSTTIPEIEAGTQYRVTAWVKKTDRYATDATPGISAFGKSTTKAVPLNTWTQISLDVTPTVTNGVVNKKLSITSRIQYYSNSRLYVDNIVIEKI